MAKKAKPAAGEGSKSTSGHKYKQTVVRFHDRMRVQLEILAEQECTSLTTEIVIAVRDRLTAKGLWPPAASTPAPKPTATE